VLETGCWGEYLDLRGMKWQGNGESCTVGSFFLTIQRIFFSDPFLTPVRL
jgi:hypothetical protein